MVIVAPTGVAAVTQKGVTIPLFQMPFGLFYPTDCKYFECATWVSFRQNWYY
jgi:hypothetical protein